MPVETGVDFMLKECFIQTAMKVWRRGNGGDALDSGWRQICVL